MARDFLTVASDFDGKFQGGERVVGELDRRLGKCGVRTRTRESILKAAMIKTIVRGEDAGRGYDGIYWLGEHLSEMMRRRRVRCVL
jgi:hypothetical protein